MSHPTPLVSVVTPTYKRTDLLQRAVESVRAQSHANWEMIVSDDEDPPGAAWEMLDAFARLDDRIRPIRNPGPHGQSGNVNHAMRHARGEWIKPLYDDDLLRPDCLEVFLQALRGLDGVALATCFVERFRAGVPVRSESRGRRPERELIARPHAQLAMYLQDIDIGMPTQVMVRREAVARGAVFEEAPGILALVDSLWYARVLRHGDLLVINRTLVEEHQGAHETATSITTEAMYDRELIRLRELLWPEVDPALNPPPLSIVKQQLRLIRALHRLSNGRPLAALKLAAGAWHPQAWRLALGWLRRRRNPGQFRVVPRVPLPPSDASPPAHLRVDGID